MDRHPEHEAVHREVRSWYTASTPEIGMSVLPVAYGFLAGSDRAEGRRLVLTVDSPEEVAAALDAARQHYGSSSFDVWVDERSRAARLTPTLRSAGMEPVQDTAVLALVGDLRAARGPAGLSVEEVVDPEQLREWATVRIQGFADSERSPTAEQLQAEITVRQAEWPVCRYRLSRLGDQAVGILAHYTGRDQMVFLLATRHPFRHRGIAQAMLATWAHTGGQDLRSLLINCDDGGQAAALYRRMGFTDQVYWYRRYRHQRPAV